MKRWTTIVLLVLLFFVFSACKRVTNKTEQVIDKMKKKTMGQIDKQSKKVVDKIFPPFNHDIPDTENNKQRFKDFLNVDISNDVKNIYCFDDAIGIDASYMFSFNCSSSTSEQIITANGLKPDTSDQVFTPQYEFPWWDAERVSELKRYCWTNGSQYYKYYWYDDESQKAYFFDFDM